LLKAAELASVLKGVPVAYDIGLPFTTPTGVTRYALELADALETLGVHLRRYLVSLRALHHDPRVARWRVPARPINLLWWMFGWPPIQRIVGEVGLVHGTNFVLPPSRRVPAIVTLHDLSFMPEHGYLEDPRLKRMTPWSVRHASLVITPSATIADEVSERLELDRERVFVTPLGISPGFFTAEPGDQSLLDGLGIRKPFAMALGTIQPRKNLNRLLEAWRAAGTELDGWQLVLVGPKGWGPEPPAAPRVVRTGWLDEVVIQRVLAAADVFCYPSLYEGFGLPPLEAMAAGTPVVVGDYGAARELLEGAAVIVDRHDVGAIADGLIRLSRDESLRTSLAVAGRARAKGFTWEATARSTVAAYDRALGS
jgi:glycosyltransferase involved in cell wall biosynthesis